MSANDSHGSRHLRLLGAAALASLLLAAGCGPSAQSGVTEAADDPALGPALAASGCVNNSVEGNGLSQNGLSQNGLCQNGLAGKALNLAGLATPSFAPWFNTNPTLSDVVMKYVYKCAAPAGTSITWTNPTTGVSYTWAGGLGLAPGWVGGAAATLAEQQVVTACLGALVNKYGVSVNIAVEGRTATGAQIPYRQWETATYLKEGCFFGNLFTNEGIFVGVDHPAWDSKTSSVRACALGQATAGPSAECPPLYNVGSCAQSCIPAAGGLFYESCTRNGVTYKPLSTRISASDVYKCGDGVCQFTEKCGTGTSWDSCLADCGPCP